jgi:hypothetical protein
VSCGVCGGLRDGERFAYRKCTAGHAGLSIGLVCARPSGHDGNCGSARKPEDGPPRCVCAKPYRDPRDVPSNDTIATLGELARSSTPQTPTFEQFCSGDARTRDIYGAPIPDGRIGTWQQTASGTQMWPLDPRPEDINLLDIARGIANECRYGKQLKRRGQWYSVAEHSVLVSVHVAKLYPDHPEWAQEASMHDAAEAYQFGDVPRPLKHDPSVEQVVARIEEPWERSIFMRYQIKSTTESRAAIKRVDNLILLDEICEVTKRPEMYAGRHMFDHPDRLYAQINCWQPAIAEVMFLHHVAAIFPELRDEAHHLIDHG